EDAPRGTLATRRDAHGMELLRIRALARAGLAGEHPGEVELHDLAAGLRYMVLGGDAGGLADDEARVDGSCLLGRLIDDVRGRRRDDHGLWHRFYGRTPGLLRRDGGRPHTSGAWRLHVTALGGIEAGPSARAD